MLNFKTISIAVIVLLALGIAGGWQWPNIVLLVIGYTILLVWGSYRVDSQFYMPVICSGDTGGKKIAISFDDGPDAETTKQVLDILAEKKLPAAFFCIGHKLDAQAALVQRATREGHMIGNHSYSHVNAFGFFSASKVKKELEQTNTALEKITGKKTRFFRPPFGVTNPNIAKAVRQTGMKAIGWNIRSLDTVAQNEEKLLANVLGSLKPGAIVLFHDTMPVTVHILPDFIDSARNLGYVFVRLDELINEKAYA
ncbi:MAG: polysaccharide deacetylase family protein [Flavihumibacter sp.]